MVEIVSTSIEPPFPLFFLRLNTDFDYFFLFINPFDFFFSHSQLVGLSGMKRGQSHEELYATPDLQSDSNGDTR